MKYFIIDDDGYNFEILEHVWIGEDGLHATSQTGTVFNIIRNKHLEKNFKVELFYFTSNYILTKLLLELYFQFSISDCVTYSSICKKVKEVLNKEMLMTE